MTVNVEAVTEKLEAAAPNAHVPKFFYTTEEAAYMLGLKVGTLRTYRNQGKGPRYIHTSTDTSLVLYPYEDLMAYVEKLKKNGR